MDKKFTIPEPVVSVVKPLMKNKNTHFFVFKERKKNGPFIVTDTSALADAKRLLELSMMLYYDSLRDAGKIDDFAGDIDDLGHNIYEQANGELKEDSTVIKLSRKKAK